MAEYRDPEPGDYPWNAPAPLGYAQADTAALFIAAPLLTAAALSLAGVVGGADDEFRWPGPILLLLVVAALALVASIQLNYHGRLYLYSHDDLASWYSEKFVCLNKAHLYERQRGHQDTWKTYNAAAVRCFNAGTVLLGIGIAAALVPPDCSKQAGWRWTAAAVVLVATVIDAIWVSYLQLKVAHRPSRILHAVRRIAGRN